MSNLAVILLKIESFGDVIFLIIAIAVLIVLVYGYVVKFAKRNNIDLPDTKFSKISEGIVNDLDNSNTFGNRKKMKKDIEFEKLKNELWETKEVNEARELRKQIKDEMRKLELRNAEIDLELKKLPITEMEARAKLQQELIKNQNSYNQLYNQFNG